MRARGSRRRWSGARPARARPARHGTSAWRTQPRSARSCSPPARQASTYTLNRSPATRAIVSALRRRAVAGERHARSPAWPPPSAGARQRVVADHRRAARARPALADQLIGARARVRRRRADQRGQLRPRGGGRRARRRRLGRRSASPPARSPTSSPTGASSARRPRQGAGGGAGDEDAGRRWRSARSWTASPSRPCSASASPPATGVSVGLLAAIFVSNLPEAIGSATRCATRAPRRQDRAAVDRRRLDLHARDRRRLRDRRHRVGRHSRPSSTASPPARCW